MRISPMLDSIRKRLILLTLAGLLGCPQPGAFAADAWVKLGRGMGNTLLGVLEVPHQVINMGKVERYPIAVLGGIPKGIAYAVGRTLVGVYEVVTFPIPVPQGYEVIMEPEFIIPRAE